MAAKKPKAPAGTPALGPYAYQAYGLIICSMRALPKLDGAEHLRQCAALLRQTSLVRLQRPRSLAVLPEVAEAIERATAAAASAGASPTGRLLPT